MLVILWKKYIFLCFIFFYFFLIKKKKKVFVLLFCLFNYFKCYLDSFVSLNISNLRLFFICFSFYFFLLMTIGVGFLLGFHFKLIFRNKTTIESSENKKDASVFFFIFIFIFYFNNCRNMIKDGKKILDKFLEKIFFFGFYLFVILWAKFVLFIIFFRS